MTDSGDFIIRGTGEEGEDEVGECSCDRILGIVGWGDKTNCSG